MKGEEVGGVFGGEVRSGFWWGNLRERDYSDALRIDWRIILEWILKEIELEGVDWIYLAQDRDRLLDIVNKAAYLQIP